eukprot:COSAG05_NODE_1023_length_6126_cov_6.196117_9_plen_74_part_00
MVSCTASSQVLIGRPRAGGGRRADGAGRAAAAAAASCCMHVPTVPRPTDRPTERPSVPSYSRSYLVGTTVAHL